MNNVVSHTGAYFALTAVGCFCSVIGKETGNVAILGCGILLPSPILEIIEIENISNDREYNVN